MSTTNNPDSLLWRLRQLSPERPLSQFEAYRIAELQANRFLQWSEITQPGTPNEIVSGLPFVEVILRNDLPISGLTNWYKPRWLIVLNGTEPDVRRRFSLMHEFKHIVDHERISYLYPTTWSNDSARRAELVADSFAAAVLMPKMLVKRRFGQGVQDTTELAAEFGVSAVAMRYRLQQLRLIEPTRRCDHRHLAAGDITGYLRQAWRAEDVRLFGVAA